MAWSAWRILEKDLGSCFSSPKLNKTQKLKQQLLHEIEHAQLP